MRFAPSKVQISLNNTDGVTDSLKIFNRETWEDSTKNPTLEESMPLRNFGHSEWTLPSHELLHSGQRCTTTLTYELEGISSQL
ncbi:hypothetical protein NPIL_415621 [Nephila pilipes]|uniref:Uncharacterized protein n=1 Tax=Nephila pilipes TaxID=299642 RepID=A0A8X6JJU9_NEPPI|nr:hypothetical protein NPIL_415621 [Nephila pilipes]